MMTPKKLALAAAALSFSAVAAAAQDSGTCMHSDKAYSSGSIIAMGKVAYKCGPSESGQMRWASVSAASDANCVYAGEEYGRGALLVVDVHTLNCSSGQWFLKK